jgi:hypothetical protein
MLKQLLSCLLFISVSTVTIAQAYTINTVAGSSSGVSMGDGGPATIAGLQLPGGVAVDDSGNMYIAETAANRVRKVNTKGIISTIAGNGTAGYSGDGGQATAAELNGPRGITVDPFGDVFVTDTRNNCIRRITASGLIGTIIGTGFNAGTGLGGYSGDGGIAENAELNNPWDIATDSNGNIFIADAGNHVVRMVNLNDTIYTIAGTGTLGYSGDGGPAIHATFRFPVRVALDNKSNLFIDDASDHVIRKVDRYGIISTVAGTGFGAGTSSGGYSGDGGPATAAELNSPYGLWLDTLGDIFISDQSNNRIRMVNSKGIINTIAGNGTYGFSGDGGPATAAELSGPSGITMNNYGDVVFVDQNRVRELTSVTSVNELLNKNAVMLFPDPNNGVFEIKGLAKGLKCVIDIYNMFGEEVASSISSKGGTSNISTEALPSGEYGWAFNLRNQPAGMYLYKVTCEDGSVNATGKFIVQ